MHIVTSSDTSRVYPSCATGTSTSLLTPLHITFKPTLHHTHWRLTPLTRIRSQSQSHPDTQLYTHKTYLIMSHYVKRALTLTLSHTTLPTLIHTHHAPHTHHIPTHISTASRMSWHSPTHTFFISLHTTSHASYIGPHSTMHSYHASIHKPHHHI